MFDCRGAERPRNKLHPYMTPALFSFWFVEESSCIEIRADVGPGIIDGAKPFIEVCRYIHLNCNTALSRRKLTPYCTFYVNEMAHGLQRSEFTNR
jgi:hypothetical protein